MTTTLYELSLTDLELSIHLGWPDEERVDRQLIWLDLQLRFTQKPAACDNDELNNTVCYDQLASTITQQCQAKTYKLIEHLAQDIYAIAKSYTQADCALTVKKQAPINNLKGNAIFRISDWR